MTKRVIAALALIAAALTISCLTLGAVRKTGGALLGFLREAQTQYAEGGDYGKPLDQAEQLWQDKRGLLGVLLKHSDTDEIEKFFYKIARFRELGETKALFDAVEDCCAAVEVMLRGEDPAARNIF